MTLIKRQSRCLLAIYLVMLFFSTSCSSHHKATPPSVYVTRPSPTPIPSKKRIVFLDPGHGGTDKGTQSRCSIRMQEKTLTLEVSKLVQGYLKQMGHDSILTRTNDVFVPLRKRVELANKKNAFIFVSIHFNSAPNSAIRGAEVFYYKDTHNVARVLKSRKLADLILHRLKETLPTKSRGVKPGDFCVIRETNMPAVLVEAAFLSNAKEVKLLSNKVYKQKIARAIATGINQYLQAN